MEVIFYTEFSKRKNSTKNPESSGAISVGVTKEVKLKGQVDKINPTFFVASTEQYVYCKAWGMYYFVHRTSYDIDGAQVVYCNLDVLGTWKQTILNTYAYVAYSSSDYNVDVIDTRIAQRVTIGTDYESERSMFSNTGTYIISTANDDSLYGGVTTYAVDETVLRNIVSGLMVDSSLWASLEQWFNDVSSSIISLRWVPVPYSYFESSQGANVVIGSWDSGEQGYVVSDKIGEVKVLHIPKRYSDFRRSTMTRYMLALPFIGVVDLDPNELIGDTSIQIMMRANLVSGVINYSVEVNGAVLNTYTGSFGRQIPLSTNSLDAVGAINGYSMMGGSIVGGIVSGSIGNAGGVMGAYAGLIAGAAKATMSEFKKDFSTMGGFGGGYGEELITGYYLIEYTFDTQTEPSELRGLYGRPLCKVVRVGDLSGYVQTHGFSIELSAMDTVRDMINALMDSGVYLE